MAVGRGGDCCSWLHLRFLPVTFIKLGSTRLGENPSISFWEKLRKNWLLGPRRRVYLEGTQDPSNTILTSSAVVHGPAGNIQTKKAPEFWHESEHKKKSESSPEKRNLHSNPKNSASRLRLGGFNFIFQALDAVLTWLFYSCRIEKIHDTIQLLGWSAHPSLLSGNCGKGVLKLW